MKKGLLLFLCFLLTIIGVIFMSSCGSKRTKGIKDFPQYKNLDVEVSHILVYWDVNSSEPVNFTIDSADDIKFVMEKLQDRSTFKKADTAADTGHTYMVLVGKDDSQTKVSLHQINYNKDIYVYVDSTIYNYIYSIGVNKGLLK